MLLRSHEKPTPTEANAITGREEFFTSDAYLRPEIEDDPLLREWTLEVCSPILRAYLRHT